MANAANHGNVKPRRLLDALASWCVSHAGAILVAALFAASLALYARTMAPGLLDGDEGEFQINIFRLGVSHTGYPTFFLLGKLWTLLVPIGTIATRANLFSAFWGALSIAAVFVLIRFLTRNTWAALLTALLFLGSRVEWSQSVIPRPYTLNSLFVVAIVLLFFLWRVGKVDLTVPVFVFGLSLTNHRTIMWFGPAIALFVLIADYEDTFRGLTRPGNLAATLRKWIARSTLFKPRRILALVAAFVLPLVLYAYVFWRGESDVGVEFHWKDFNDEILGGYVRASWRFGPLDWLISRVTELYIPMLIEQFTAFGFLAGLVGIAALALNKPPRAWPPRLPPRQALLFLVLANLANTAFGIIFWVIDIDKFFLPSFITFLFFTGVGIAVIWEWAADRVRLRGLPASAFRLALVLVFAGGIGFLLRQNYPLNDWSWRVDVARAWDENLAQPLEPNAVIAGNWESITPLEYAMYVDGRRRDLDRWKLLVKNYQLGQVPYGSRQEDIEKAVRDGRPVYLTVYPGETETLGALLDEFRLTRVGELWRVLDAPPRDTAVMEGLKTSKPVATFADADGNSLELLGYGIHPTPALRAGDFGLATLYWRTPQSIPGRLAISFRLTDAQNHLISQRDSEPGSGLSPTNGWLPNEVVQDDIGFFIPPDAPPGNYRLALVVYNTATGENWKSERGIAWTLNELNVARTLEMPPVETLAIPHPLNQPLSPFRLLGYDTGAEQSKGGDVLDLSLWWQLDQPSAHDEQIAIGLRGEGGRVTNLYQGAPIEGFAAERWGRAAILRGRYALSIPLDFAGSASLVVQSGGQTAELTRLNVQPSGRTLTPPRIARPLAAQIGDSIRLLGYDVDKARARPGETVRVTLYWQALRAPGQSYTVFVHALDAAGVLRGQKDAIPRDGALPTDRWLAGEVVADTFDVTLSPDAPAGNYQFEVGMYFSDTGTRLPIADDNGAALPDARVLLGQFVVNR